MSMVPLDAVPEELSAAELSAEERQRYARHLSLPELGLEGQKRLRSASVLCVGTGGLGSPLLLYLAAAGVGRIEDSGLCTSCRVDEFFSHRAERGRTGRFGVVLEVLE